MDPEVVHLLRRGQKIAAIKRYREVYGSDLKSAKEAVDALEEGREVAPPSILAPPQTLTEVASDPSMAEIDALVRAGHKIDAIRVYRQRYSVGLKEAKDAIDAWPTGARASQRPQVELGGFMLEVGANPGAESTHVPIPPLQLPALQYSATPPAPPSRNTAAPCEGHVQDRNIGQAIDLALNMGRREEAIALYVEKYGVPRQEAERQINARAAGAGSTPKTGCFIATAAFGTPLAPEVETLRRFRDRVLRRSYAGRIATRLYYRLSPPVARKVERNLALGAAARAVIRWILPPR